MEDSQVRSLVDHRLKAISPGRQATVKGCSPSAIQKPKLLDQVRQAIRTRHYSDRTEKAYVHWIKRFIFFHNKRHPIEMGEAEIAQFLSSLASDGHVSASTQNQAFNALLFLYKEVLGKKIGLIEGVVRAKRPQRLPVVLTKEEVKKVIDHMNGLPRLMAILLYGGGLRLMECCRLRVKDISKSRLLPLHPSTVRRLKSYVHRRDDLYPQPLTSRFFLSNRGTPLTDWVARQTFVKLSRQIGLRKTSDRFGPRLHDLRHRFAVTTLLDWYRTGVDVEQRLAVLSTYLGHAHVTDTYWYLSAIPELLALTKDRLEKRWEAFS